MFGKRKLWPLGATAALAAVAVLAAACGSSSSSSTPTPTTAAGSSPAASATTGSASPAASSSASSLDAAKAKLATITGDTTGVTDTEVKIGSYYALTGPASVYADIEKAWLAYFDNVNKNGGIAGRQIKFTVYDDGYNPTNTKNVVNKLINQDKVFMLFNGLGTPTGNAVLPDVLAAGIPSYFLATGDAKWADQGPSIIGLQPDYVTEGTVLGKYAATNYAGKKAAIIYQNDDFGKEGLQGVKAGLGSALQVVDTETYEANAADWNAQALKAINAGAQVLLVYSTPTQYAAALKYVKQQGKTVVWISSSVAASSSTAKLAAGGMDGTFTTAYIKDPTDPDPNIQKAVQFFKDHGIANPNAFSLYGYMAAQHLERLLTVVGKNLNRASLEYALQNVAFQGDWQSSLLLQPTIITQTDHKPIEYMWIQRWDEAKGVFTKVSDIFNEETTKK